MRGAAGPRAARRRPPACGSSGVNLARKTGSGALECLDHTWCEPQAHTTYIGISQGLLVVVGLGADGAAKLDGARGDLPGLAGSVVARQAARAGVVGAGPVASSSEGGPLSKQPLKLVGDVRLASCWASVSIWPWRSFESGRPTAGWCGEREVAALPLPCHRLAIAPLLLEAARAVDRLVAARLEGHLGLLPHCVQTAVNIWRGARS